MPKNRSRSKSEQFGIYEEDDETDFTGQKNKKIMSGKPKYEKVPDVNSGGGTFATNYVSTTRYSRWSFLSKATIQQYKRGANVYLPLTFFSPKF
jgi:hypothetical protein